MIGNVKAWLLAKAKANAALLAVLGSAERIEEFRPSKGFIWPALLYRTIDNSNHDDGYGDDAAFSDQFECEWQIWSNTEADCYNVADPLDSLMQGLGFGRTFYTEFTEEKTFIKHAIVRYGRSLTASDLM